jgi:feruloyl esterase
MYHGWADPLLPSQSSINYFNALVREGGHPIAQPVRFDHEDAALRQTQSYARLFMAPGMYHCSGGPGPNVFDALTPLVDWVERGVPPETITATKYVNDTPASGVQMTRPLCVFPKVAKYNGHGSTDSAASFTCVPDEADYNQMPAPQYGP